MAGRPFRGRRGVAADARRGEPHAPTIAALKIQDDPEAIFQQAWIYADLGEHARALPELEKAVAKGYFVAPTLATRPQFDALRGEPRFAALLAQAEAGRARALAAFREAGGERLIGAA